MLRQQRDKRSAALYQAGIPRTPSGGFPYRTHEEQDRSYFASFNISSLERVTNLLMRSGDRVPWAKRARS